MMWHLLSAVPLYINGIMTICSVLIFLNVNSFKRPDKLIQVTQDSFPCERLTLIQIFLLITHLVYHDQASSRLSALAVKKTIFY